MEKSTFEKRKKIIFHTKMTFSKTLIFGMIKLHIFLTRNVKIFFQLFFSYRRDMSETFQEKYLDRKSEPILLNFGDAKWVKKITY